MLGLLQQSPVLLITLCFLLGLLVGSFLNVVGYRLPLMMEAAWAREIAEHAEGGEPGAAPRFDLVWPPSACPACARRIRPQENIPVLSYLLLRGKCAGCGTAISARYPVVELGVAILSAVVAWRFGLTWTGAAALLFTWTLVPLTLIDIDRYLLPDSLTLPLLWAGLVISLLPVAEAPILTDLQSSVIGAVAGYLSLWGVFHLFRLLTGKEGMGYGDFKLLAAIGAWLGWQMLPLVIILSAVVGAILGSLHLALTRRSPDHPIPFGPYLCAAGWVALMWGERLLTLYMDVML